MPAQEIVQVTAPRAPAVVPAARTPVEWLARDGAVDVVSQGHPLSQADLSIRGSAFSGAGLVLGGIPLRHPQTEHFHADLAVPAAFLTPPRVAAGTEQALTGAGHLAGSVLLDWRPVRSGGELALGLGEGGGLEASVRAARARAGRPGGVGAFGRLASIPGIDYADNDLDVRSGGLHLQAGTGAWRADAAVLLATRTFGARGYYGVNPAWPAEEQVDDLLVLGTAVRAAAASTRRVAAAWRTTHDAYRLWIDPAAPYVNRHRAETTTGTADGMETLGRAWQLGWLVQAGTEQIRGNRLGNHDRGRAAAQLVPARTWGAWTVAAGARQEVFSDAGGVLLPVVRADRRVGAGQTVFAGYSESARRPSYTELNYESPGSLGNSGLDTERAAEAELGWRWGAAARPRGRAALFRRVSRHTVDWVKPAPASPRWEAADLGRVETWGLELEACLAHTRRWRVDAGYRWLEKEADPALYAARYVLDYPRHRAGWQLDWRPLDDWRLSWEQAFLWLTGTPAREEAGQAAWLSRVGLHWLPAAREGLHVSLVLENAWDEDTPRPLDLPPAGRRLWLAAGWRWGA